MKLYAKTVLLERFSDIGIGRENIKFRIPNYELKEEIQNFNYERAEILVNIKSGEYNNKIKQPLISQGNIFQGILGTVTFLVQVFIIGTDEEVIDEIEDLITKSSNRFFSVGSFNESNLKVLSVQYGVEDEQITPSISSANLTMSLLLPVYTQEEMTLIKASELKIKHKYLN